MKKYSLTGLMLFVLLAFIPSSGHAVGRLNFMLTNLTGLDITDVRIAPTYYPISDLIIMVISAFGILLFLGLMAFSTHGRTTN